MTSQDKYKHITVAKLNLLTIVVMLLVNFEIMDQIICILVVMLPMIFKTKHTHYKKVCVLAKLHPRSSCPYFHHAPTSFLKESPIT